VITVSTTSPEEARAATAAMHGMPPGQDFKVYLLGREVAASMPAPAPGWTATALDLKAAGWPGETNWPGGAPR
jgi:hypothetical protein